MAYSKKIFITVFICLHVSLVLFAQKQNRYNVLFIISDDLRPELGAYGVSQIKTIPEIEMQANNLMNQNHGY